MSSDKVITITEEMTVWIVLRVSEDWLADTLCECSGGDLCSVYKEPKGSQFYLTEV